MASSFSELATGVLGLETNWTGELRSNRSVEDTLALFQKVGNGRDGEGEGGRGGEEGGGGRRGEGEGGGGRGEEGGGHADASRG
jgi:hypothetical protein